jgi:hypothetical protein
MMLHDRKHNLAECIVCGNGRLAALGRYRVHPQFFGRLAPDQLRVVMYMICEDCVRTPVETSRKIEAIMTQRLGLEKSTQSRIF